LAISKPVDLLFSDKRRKRPILEQAIFIYTEESAFMRYCFNVT
jgi:hypothetical protein